MIPILRSPVFLGRNGISPEAINYVALAFEIAGSATKVHLYTSATAGKFRQRAAMGDIRVWAKSGQLSVPDNSRMVKFGGALYVAANHVTSSGTRGLVFRSIDGKTFNRVPHSLDGVDATASKGISQIAVGAGYLVALMKSGRCVYSSNGTTFIAGGYAIPQNGNALSLAGSDSLLVAGGNNGVVRYTANPASTWTESSLDYFGGEQVFNIAFGNLFVGITSGGTIGRSGDGASWSSSSSPTTAYLSHVIYRTGEWFIVGGFPSSVFLRANTSNYIFSTPASHYWDTPSQSSLWSWLNDGSDIVAFWGSGRVARYSGSTWQQVDAGLPDLPFIATGYRG